MDLGRLAEELMPNGKAAAASVRTARSSTPAVRPWRWRANWSVITRTPRGDRGGAGLDPSSPSTSPVRRTSCPTPTGSASRPHAGIAALGGGHDVVERPRRAGSPLAGTTSLPRTSHGQTRDRGWLEMFSATTLPGITVHEVAPGISRTAARCGTRPVMCAARSSRPRSSRAGPITRRNSAWTGFGAGTRGSRSALVEPGPRHPAGLRHQGTHGRDDGCKAARRFEADTHLAGPAALSEASRATFDPPTGATPGQARNPPARERARKEWAPVSRCTGSTARC